MSQELWQKCVSLLQSELPTQQFNTWIRPLQAEASQEDLQIWAPNRFVLDWVKDKYAERIKEIIQENQSSHLKISFNVGEVKKFDTRSKDNLDSKPRDKTKEDKQVDIGGKIGRKSNINKKYTFASFVEGKSNQLAKAAASQVVESPGVSYNPLFIYGGSGLGKTHLMLAVGNEILARDSNVKVAYIRSETFVMDMVKAIQNKTMDEFKRYYRAVDVLLIDDIHFFARKTQSQEEFFHTFNSLLEGEHQIILTSDKYPKELDGVDERLKSRFGWGLTVEIEPPELETRAAILMKKAEEANKVLPDDAAFFYCTKNKISCSGS